MNFSPYCAAERSLHILLEAAIGAAVHTNTQLGLPERDDAACTIGQILEHYPLEEITRLEMKGAVDLRNAIVHDYLNLEWALVQAVIQDKKYLTIGQFVDHCCNLLRNS